MKKIALLTVISFYLLFAKLHAQVGIGTSTPNAATQLHVDVGTSTTKGFLVTGTSITGSTPNLGAGRRLMFYPGKGAFRAGFVQGTEWDDGSVGQESVAMGYGTIAGGRWSIALGRLSKATAESSTAIGDNNTASGQWSTAMGLHTTASGAPSFSMGLNTIASGSISTAFGNQTTASGSVSTAMGSDVNTNVQAGAFIIGDSNPLNQGVTFSGAPDQFVARFNNGYYLLTSGDNPRFGVSIGNNGNFWVGICDKNRKENFEPINGEDVLQKIAGIKFSSWNYKMQDAKTYRHYGIMAQDFYNAFGHDKYGTIGTDTTVNPIDMIGIDMAAIQALDNRTNELKIENEKLKSQNAVLNTKMDEITELRKKLELLKSEIEKIKKCN